MADKSKYGRPPSKHNISSRHRVVVAGHGQVNLSFLATNPSESVDISKFTWILHRRRNGGIPGTDKWE